ncbi:hypothetical protein B566_EDAN008711 [Ephemera danica]|nr:hypothetical protein B566_EDAN008711 [Ephemera danica]
MRSSHQRTRHKTNEKRARGIMEGTELTLRWEKFGLSRGLHEMLASKDLVDVTIACQGEYMQAHKTVLAACSTQFRKIFLANPCQHPVIFMQDSKLSHLQAVLNFMYTGEATVLQHELAGFMKTAEALKVSGLTTPAQGPGPVLHQKKTDAAVSPPKKTRTSQAQPWVNLQGLKMETPGVYIVEPSQLQASVNMDNVDTELTDWFDESAKEHDEGNTSQPSTSAGVSSRGRKQDLSNAVPPMWVWNAAEEKLEKVVPGSASGKKSTKLYNCNTCNRPHKSKNSLRAHIYKYHSGKDVGQEHKCSVCDKVYKLKGGLLVHMENVHGKNAVTVTCIDCGKQYKNKMAHYKHVYAKHRHRITNKASATIIITEAGNSNYPPIESMEETT